MLAVIDRRPTERLVTDVLVVGGGAAGLAAAVTAAGQGAEVVLSERYGFCGGGAVAGLSGTICGIYAASDRDDKPVKVVHGFLDRFIEAMEYRGGLSDPIRYGKTFTRVHDPLIWREAADYLLAEAGITVIYHSQAIAALMDGQRVLGGRLHTKSGLVDVEAKVTVDATGDADIAAMSGFATRMGDDGRVQNPTMIFRMMGVDIDRFLQAYGDDTIMPAAVSDLIEQARAGGADLPRKKIWLFPTTRPGELLCNCTRVTDESGRELNTVAWRDFSIAEFVGRRQVRAYLEFFRTHLAGCENAYVNDTGVQVGVRQTRQIAGLETLANDDVVQGRKFDDGIARSPWPIELHTGDKPIVRWILDDYYEVPFGCFVPREGEGLFAAGRCLSAEHEAVASARVTAQCFSYGHAIGHAAAIVAKERYLCREISGEDIRGHLNRDGARLNA